jgi:hypothetical protein
MTVVGTRFRIEPDIQQTDITIKNWVRLAKTEDTQFKTVYYKIGNLRLVP